MRKEDGAAGERGEAGSRERKGKTLLRERRTSCRLSFFLFLLPSSLLPFLLSFLALPPPLVLSRLKQRWLHKAEFRGREEVLGVGAVEGSMPSLSSPPINSLQGVSKNQSLLHLT